MSASNPSRIPFEMMAAGLPVVELYRENNLYDFPNDGVMLADSTPEAIANAIITILKDDKLQKTMSESGESFMKDYPLEKGYAEFIEAFNNYFNNKTNKEESIKKSYTKKIVESDKALAEKLKKLPEVSFGVINNHKSLVHRALKKGKRIIKKIIK